MEPKLHLSVLSPHIKLQPYIEFYWLASSGMALDVDRKVSVFPITMHTLLFFLEDTPARVVNNQERKMTSKCVIGNITQKQEYVLRGNLNFICIRFKSAGFFRFFNLSPKEFVDDNVCFESFETDNLHDQLHHAKNEFEVQTCLDSYFLKKLKKVTKKDFQLEPVRYVIGEIFTHHGQVTFNQMYDQINMCERKFRDHFLTSTGLSPKKFARIVKFNYVYQQLLTSKLRDVHDIIFKAGYFDQAHFSKEFKYFTHSTFSEFQMDFAEFDHIHRLKNVSQPGMTTENI